VGRSHGRKRIIWTPSLEEARAVTTQADARVALILELIIWTGMRIREAAGLRCVNVDVAQAVLSVRERKVRGDIPKAHAGQRALLPRYLTERIAPLTGKA
jgi:site-specific recombinase XerD